MDGIETKVRILRAGLKVWQVAREANMPATRLSLILNNHVAPSINEVAAVNTVLDRHERRNRQAEIVEGGE